MKTIVITGATAGIGRALAVHYAKHDVCLILLGRNQNKLHDVTIVCRNLGANVETLDLDLANVDIVRTEMSKLVKRYTIDLFISNAGVTSSTIDHTPEPWGGIQHTLNVNLLAAIAVADPVLKDMQRRRCGQVAYVSSIAAYYGMPLTPSYCASKAGLKAYAEAMRGLLAPHNVSVSLVLPGFVKTSISDQFQGNKPFMITAEKAAEKIAKGLDKRSRAISFPWSLSVGMRLLAILPAFVSDRILAQLRY